MAKAPAVKPPQQDTQAPKMPGVTEIQALRNFIEAFGRNLTDAGYTLDLELLNNCLCNSMFQSNGIGIILTDEGEFSLISPFGLIQGFGTLPDDDAIEKLYDELETLLNQFCQVTTIDDDTLYSFELADHTVGYWIVSCGETTIHPKPRLLAEAECVNALQLETEWEKMVG
jgi:hypothetical protein